MDSVEFLVSELACGDDARAEQAASRLAKNENALPALEALLKSDQVDMRFWAMRTLAGMAASNRVTQGLRAGLEDGSSEVRQAAALGLCHHPDPGSIPALVDHLSDPDTMVASLASNALIKIGTEASSSLVEILNDGSDSAKLMAVRALAEIKDPQTIPALMKALESNSAIMQYWAEQGLDKLGMGMVYIKPE